MSKLGKLVLIFCLMCGFVGYNVCNGMAASSPKFGTDPAKNEQIFLSDDGWEKYMRQADHIYLKEGQIAAYTKLVEGYNIVTSKNFTSISVDQIKEISALALYLFYDYSSAESAAEEFSGDDKIHAESILKGHQNNFKNFVNPIVVFDTIFQKLNLSDKAIDEIFEKTMKIFHKFIEENQ